MKKRLFKRFTIATLNLYNEAIYRDFPGMPENNLAQLFRLQEHVRKIQQARLREEPQSTYWSLPVTVIIVEVNGRHRYETIVEPEWEKENVLYLDFDQYE